MIRGNFDIKKIETKKPSETEEFEQLIEKFGVGSHMVFRSKNKDDDELFVDDL